MSFFSKEKGVTYNKDGSIENCLFCDFASGAQSKKLLYEDDSCVAFFPLEISGRQHFMMVPKQHIKSVKDVDLEVKDLVTHMGKIGLKLLQSYAGEKGRDLSANDTTMLYHVPPFNSIDHLHLHCFELPFNNIWYHKKYNINSCWCMSHEEVLKNLNLLENKKLTRKI